MKVCGEIKNNLSIAENVIPPGRQMKRCFFLEKMLGFVGGQVKQFYQFDVDQSK